MAFASWLSSAFSYLYPAPEHLIVQLGSGLPTDREWMPFEVSPDTAWFAGCTHCRWVCPEGGQIVLGLAEGLVEGVSYDLAVYRENDPEMLRKTRFIAESHGLRRMLDNHGGAVLYRSDEAFGVYAYVADRFLVHSARTSLESAD